MPRRRTFSITPVRTPSSWADAQRAFAAAVVAGQPAPTIEVVVLAVDNPDTWIPAHGGMPLAPVAIAQTVRAIIRRSRRGPAGTYLVLWPLAAKEGQAPSLIVPIASDDLPDLDSPVAAAVWGEFAPNGALAVAIGGRLVYPNYNPQTPWGDLRKLGLRRLA